MALGFRRKSEDTERTPAERFTPVTSEAAPAPPAPAPSAPPAAPSTFATASASPAPDLAADGSLEFEAIYRHARLEPAPFSAEQTVAMLAELPLDMPLEMKRQTVGVTLKAIGSHIGATAETIVSDARQKRGALDAFVEQQQRQSDHNIAATEAEIEELRRQIDLRNQRISASQEKLARVRTLCSSEVDRLDSVLAFFETPTPAAAPPMPTLRVVESEPAELFTEADAQDGPFQGALSRLEEDAEAA